MDMTFQEDKEESTEEFQKEEEEKTEVRLFSIIF